MAVIGAFTAGGDGTSNALATGVALTINGAGTPAVGDIPVQVTTQNSGANTLSSSAPTQAVKSGPNVSGSTTSYLTAETAGLTSGDISGNTITHTWSAGARNLAGGVLLRGRTLTGAVIGTPTTITTGATITIPTVTAVAGSDVVVVITSRNAQATAPTIDVAGVMVAAGWTLGRAVVTVGASPNIATTTWYRQNVSAGNYGGETPAVTNTPLGQHAYTIALPSAPAAAATSAIRQRRRSSGTLRKARSNRFIKAPLVVVAPPILTQAPRHRVLAAVVARRRAVASVPAQVVVASSPPPIQTQRHRVFLAAVKRGSTRARVVPAQTSVPVVDRILRARRSQPLSRRHTAAVVVPAQVVLAPPTPIQLPRHRIYLTWLPRRKPQSGPTSEWVQPVRGRRVRFQPSTRDRQAPQPVPAPTVVAPPAYPVQAVRHRIWFGKNAQRRATISAQVVIADPSLPAQMSRRRTYLASLTRRKSQPVLQGDDRIQPIRGRRARLLWTPRARQAPQPVTPQVVAPPAYPPQAVRHHIWLGKVSRGRHIAPVPAQIVLAVPALVQQPVRRHTLLTFLNRHRPAQHIPGTPHALPVAARRRVLAQTPRRGTQVVVPAQVVLAPPFVRAPGRKPRRLVAPKRGRHVTVYASTVAPVLPGPGYLGIDTGQGPTIRIG